MVRRLIESRPRSAEHRHTGGLVALVGHAGLVAGALLATLRPGDTPTAIPPVLLSWPQPPEPRDRGGASPLPGDPVVAPIEVPPHLPPIDAPSLVSSTPGVPASPDLIRGAPLTPAGDGPWASAIVEEPPALLAGRAPSYPELLRAAGITGRVVVEAVIDTLGHAEAAVRVVESSQAGFDAPALDYVRRAGFRPGRVHGRAVRVLIRLPVDFRLTSVQ